MQMVWKFEIDKICCDKMEKKLDKWEITSRNNWNFYWGNEVIFYCPFCGERCF